MSDKDEGSALELTRRELLKLAGGAAAVAPFAGAAAAAPVPASAAAVLGSSALVVDDFAAALPSQH